MILIIDNYDSFTYNLYQYVGEIYKNIKVVRNDAVTISSIKQMDLEGIIISPGPGRPEEAGISIEVIKEFKDTVPILGICLGHQCITAAFGGEVVRANKIMHGKTSIIKHNNKGLFKGLKNDLKVMRYHSLIARKETLPKVLEITAEAENEVVMGIKHKEFNVYGLQFHPESYFTEAGREIIRNFLGGICNVKGDY